MHAEVFTVATAGAVRDGLLSMGGGGWESCTVTEFPAQVDVVLVGVLVYAPEECDRQHVISVSATGSDGQAGAIGTIRIGASTPAAVVKTPFTVPVTLTVAGPVVISLSATIEDGPTFGPTEFEVRAPE